MNTSFDNQPFAFAKQFADNAFKAQAALLQGLEQMASLQLGAIEQQSRSTTEFFAAAGELRDPDGLRTLWDKGVALSRTQTEQAVALSQRLVAIGRQTAEAMSVVAQPVSAANDAAVAPGARKAAAK